MNRFRPALAALLLLTVGGCVPGFGRPVPPPEPVRKRNPPAESALSLNAPKPRPETPRPPTAPSPQAASQPPVEEARLPATPTGKNGVIGHSEDETESLLGKPMRVTEHASAKIWRYQSDDCAVDVTFFFDVSRGRFFALDVTPVTGDVTLCLTKLEGHIAS